jgi:hypothetical protein
MHSSLQKFIKYATYWLTAANGKGHGIHSPFVFQFVTDVLNDDRFFYAFETIEQANNQQQRFKKYNQLLFKIVHYYQPKAVLCIDESITNTLQYLAQTNNNTQVFCYNINNSQQNIAEQNNLAIAIDNVFFYDDISSIAINQYDLVYINTNNEDDLQNYFQLLLPHLNAQSIVIINNIHAGKPLEAVWQNLQQHSFVTLSIDLFQLGLIFFRSENKIPQHFTIRF